MRLTFPLRSSLSQTRWRTRITLWLAALTAGLVVTGFAKLAELALDCFLLVTAHWPLLPLLLTPALGMLSVWMTVRWFPAAQGSGIPQVIAATRIAATRDGDVSKLVSLRIAAGKIFAGAVALVGGFAAGREGPSVQVAASIMHAAHRFLPHSRALRASDLILAGGAAGVAAAFNTPLAGIVFAVEELGRRLETRTSGVLISTVILSGLISIALLGNYHYFGELKSAPTSHSLATLVIVGGVLCGLVGGAFSRLMLWPQRGFTQTLWIWRRRYPVRFAGICGLIVAILGCLGGGIAFGSGYNVASALVNNTADMPWYATAVRFLSTLVSYYSGIPGGIFAPALAIGATLGADVARLLGENSGTVTVIALCMAGLLAAVTQSPITSAVIVMEMIDNHEMVISLMAIALISRAVSSRFSPELYQILAHGWLPPLHSSPPNKSQGE